MINLYQADNFEDILYIQKNRIDTDFHRVTQLDTKGIPLYIDLSFFIFCYLPKHILL